LLAFGFVVSHPCADNHPADEDLTAGAPSGRMDEALGFHLGRGGLIKLEVVC
jgi:hypothetical protein